MDREHVLAEVVRTMGLQTLKPKQKEAVMAFLAGSDAFVTLSTGYGKSIICCIARSI